MSIYYGLIIPRSYNDYINKSQPVEFRKAMDNTGLIPNTASEENQLADKNFVNSTVGTNTANYIYKENASGENVPFDSIAELEAYAGTVTQNDYAFVTGIDENGNKYYDRYKANETDGVITWAKEYRLNNSSFTAEQWAAIESGITSELVELFKAGAVPAVDEVKAGEMAPPTSNAVSQVLAEYEKNVSCEVGGSNATSKGWYKFATVTTEGNYQSTTFTFEVLGNVHTAAADSSGKFHIYIRTASAPTIYETAGIHWEYRSKGIKLNDFICIVTNNGSKNTFDFYAYTNQVYKRYTIKLINQTVFNSVKINLFDNINNEVELPSEYTARIESTDAMLNNYIAGGIGTFTDFYDASTIASPNDLINQIADGSELWVQLAAAHASALKTAHAIPQAVSAGVLHIINTIVGGRCIVEIYDDNGNHYHYETNNSRTYIGNWYIDTKTVANT